jgi:23S rRNA U2552 (ribose-2'-O)-methylase RlmE/FtsJ
MIFKPTVVLFKSAQRKSGSNAWLARQMTDPYVKKRIQLTQGCVYRSRSAFKLIEMDQMYQFIPKLLNSSGKRRSGEFY